MEKLNFILVIALFSSAVFNAQEKNQSTVKYILKYETDTGKSLARVNSSIFGKYFLNPLLFKNTLVTYDDSGKKKKIKEHDIKYLEINNQYANEIVKFVTIREISDDSLVREIYKGKISWYKLYYPSDIYGNSSYHDYLVKEGKPPIRGFFTGIKKMLGELLIDRPDLQKKLDDFNKYDESDIINVLIEYNIN